MEQHLLAACDPDGGEVLHLQVAHRLGIVLDVQPCELGLRKLPGERLEARSVIDAGIAPKGAQAGDAVFLHPGWTA